MDKFEEWLIAHPLFGVILMALLGGFVSHLKSMAKMVPTEKLTVWGYWVLLVQCLLALSVRVFGAILGGMTVLFIWRASAWPWEYGFVTAAVVGMFSTEVFDWLFRFGIAWFQQKFNVRPEPPNEQR